jgi:hypothetical protein
MHVVLISCRFLLVTVRAMLDRVVARDDAHLRPLFASQAMAKRLATGLRHVEAYLRRVLLVMALEIEPTLVDARGPMRRPRGQKAYSKSGPQFRILQNAAPSSDALLQAFEQNKERLLGPTTHQHDPQTIAMTRLYQRLDQLTTIVRDPLARAKRLAFYLARNRPGPFFAPNSALRPPGAWGTEARATFDALSGETRVWGIPIIVGL